MYTPTGIAGGPEGFVTRQGTHLVVEERLAEGRHELGGDGVRHEVEAQHFAAQRLALEGPQRHAGAAVCGGRRLGLGVAVAGGDAVVRAAVGRRGGRAGCVGVGGAADGCGGSGVMAADRWGRRRGGDEGGHGLGPR